MDKEPEEVVVRIRGYKTDQYNLGEVRNHWASGDSQSLCPVEASRDLRRHYTAVRRWVRGYPSSLLPLFGAALGSYGEQILPC